MQAVYGWWIVELIEDGKGGGAFLVILGARFPQQGSRLAKFPLFFHCPELS
jgi:hypothetical protein